MKTTYDLEPDENGDLAAENMEVRAVFHYDGTPDEDEWDEPMIIPRDSLPSQRIVTLADVGGICWPDVIDYAVCEQTGAINSTSLQRIIIEEEAGNQNA